jgi:HEAT repeat protein
MRYAPSWRDRRDAALSLLSDEPSDETVKAVATTVREGRSELYDRAVMVRLGELKKPYLKELFVAFAERWAVEPEGARTGPRSPDLAAAAITALGRLPVDPELEKGLLTGYATGPDVPYAITRAALETLSVWNADGSLPTFQKALSQESRSHTVRTAALTAISRSTRPEALTLLKQHTQGGQPRPVRRTAVSLLETRNRDRAEAAGVLTALLKDQDTQVLREVLAALGRMKDKSTVAAVRALEKATGDSEIREAAKSTAETIEKS